MHTVEQREGLFATTQNVVRDIERSKKVWAHPVSRDGCVGDRPALPSTSSHKLVKMCGPQHVDKNGIHNILTDARVLVFGIYVSVLLLPCLWAGCLGLDVEKMMPTNEDLHSPLLYGSASLQPPPHQQKEGGNVTPHF